MERTIFSAIRFKKAVVSPPHSLTVEVFAEEKAIGEGREEGAFILLERKRLERT